MDIEEIRNKVYLFFKSQLASLKNPYSQHRIQLGDVFSCISEDVKDLPHFLRDLEYSKLQTIVQEYLNNGFLHFGNAGDQNASYPWLTITEYGKEVFQNEDWLPYDPDGYIKELKSRIPEIDDITLIYIKESVSAYNRRLLISASITLGIASENLMLNLIEAYSDWISEKEKKESFRKKIDNKYQFYKKYEVFKKELTNDKKKIPKEFIKNIDTILDGIFNFIRINRNAAGHPTGEKNSAKLIYSNLQIFSEYSKSIIQLVEYFKSKRDSI